MLRITLQENNATQYSFFIFKVAKESKMIKCHLSRMMGEEKVKVAEVARSTDINRSTITRLYQETAVRIDLETMDRLCRYFKCDVGDLFEFNEIEVN